MPALPHEPAHQPVITGIDSIQVLDQAMTAARTFRPLSEQELAAILNKTAQAAQGGKFDSKRPATTSTIPTTTRSSWDKPIT
jgi:hypothetical protein